MSYDLPMPFLSSHSSTLLLAVCTHRCVVRTKQRQELGGCWRCHLVEVDIGGTRGIFLFLPFSLALPASRRPSLLSRCPYPPTTLFAPPSVSVFCLPLRETYTDCVCIWDQLCGLNYYSLYSLLGFAFNKACSVSTNGASEGQIQSSLTTTTVITAHPLV